ncbi:hypothetical protein [Fundidesulfovibrio agrisoli]|uniref:hypothetical protein n=1 Tax=Fundidesulfovibrio agrisoli TaxID=2922717 RepID=UPI001FADEFC9|nr:hypothetical protein [Fundidesulfovibrio agrisoli]
MPYPTMSGPAGQQSSADGQARNELAYRRYLEQLAGFAPGESELPDEEIQRRRALAQDAVQPAQAAPRNLPPQPVAAAPDALRSALAQLAARPGMIEHLEGIDIDGDGLPDIPLGPPPMNPMARAQWQAAMANRQRRGQERQVRRAQRKVLNNQVMLAVLKANDPLFATTYNRLASYIQRIPEKIQRVYLEAVDRTPGAFLDLYIHLRTAIEYDLSKPVNNAMPQDRQPDETDPRARIRRAVAGRMAAPALESAGVLEERLGGAARSTELAELKARAKSGRAREGDLLRYLELSMNSGSGR